MNPSDALAFLNKIRDRFSAHEPEKYNRFLDIMRAYQRGQQRKDLVKTYADVKALLADHRDLLRDFDFFMPKNSGIAYMDDADQDKDDEVEVTGERTLAERNAAGFANAIMIDDDDDNHRDDAASRDEQDGSAASAAELLMPTRREAAELLMPTRRSARKRGRVEQ